jgi:hypothetical protein
LLRSEGIGGGGDELLADVDAPCRPLLEEEGPRYGVSSGEGNETAAGPLRYSSSVSQAGMVTAL